MKSREVARTPCAAIQARGTVEAFVYSPSGYGPTVPLSLGRPNHASYGLNILTELRLARARRILAFEDALLLLGDSKSGKKADYNMQPMSILGQYGIGFEVRPGVQLRATHGEGYDLDEAKTSGAPWNSISVCFQRKHDLATQHWSASDDYLEALFYPPHNEYDPYPSAAVSFSQRVVARYGVRFSKKFSLSKMRRVFVFTEPLLLFGNSRPQLSYNYSAKPMAARLVYGAGIALKQALQLRFTQGEWRNLGGYKGQSQFWSGLSLRYGW